MYLKDTIKKCDFYSLVRALSNKRVNCSDENYAECLEVFEDVLFEILLIPTYEEPDGILQNVQTGGGEYVHFYINDEPTATNITLSEAPWAKIARAKMKTLQLHSDDDLQEDLSKDEYLILCESIISEMTILKYTDKNE